MSMIYIIIFISLFILELVYFKIADRFNIIDKPNERSSHKAITLRGGGIIFYIAALFYFVYSGFDYPYFFIGLSCITIISFLDDVFTLSNKIRLLIHFSAVLLMGYQLALFDMPWYFLVLSFVLAVGVINAYNFMDGINGITVSYSLSVAGLLVLVNQQVHFIKDDFIIFIILGLLVFAFFNFRTTAKCFAGDVGSVSIAYILLFMIGLLIFNTGNIIYILFLSVYGIDAVWTIIQRLCKRENIFKAHRSHLYQILGNEVGVNRLLISFIYGALQFIIGYIVIVFANEPKEGQLYFTVILVFGLSIFYLLLKRFLLRKYLVEK